MRGYDIANITFVRSEHGLIVMDCGSSRYTAEEALKFFRSEMGDGGSSPLWSAMRMWTTMAVSRD